MKSNNPVRMLVNAVALAVLFAALPAMAQTVEPPKFKPMAAEGQWNTPMPARADTGNAGNLYFPAITSPGADSPQAGLASFQKTESGAAAVTEEQSLGPARRYGRLLKAGFYNDPYYSQGEYYTDPDNRDHYRRDHGNPHTYRDDKWYRGEIRCHPATVAKTCRENMPADPNSGQSEVRRANR